MKKDNDNNVTDESSVKDDKAGTAVQEEERPEVDALEAALEKERRKQSKKQIEEDAKIPKGMTREEYRAQKRKDLIKNFAILFLAIMLLLTFFSNTIMNVTLPEVATAYVQQGDISPQIRGTGSVTAGQPYNVVITQTRTIDSVNVKVGDTVKKDDVIYTLEDAESTELTEAETAVDTAKNNYELAMFDVNIPAADVQSIRSGKNISIDSFLSEMKEANDDHNAALKEDTDVQAAIDVLNYEKTINGMYVTADEDHDAATQASTTMSDADIKYQQTLLETNITEATADVTDLTTKKTELSATVKAYADRVGANEELSEYDQGLYLTAQSELEDVCSKLYVAQSKLDTYTEEKKKLADFSNLETRNASYYDGQIESETEHKKETAQALSEATTARDNCLAKIKSEIGLVQLRKTYQEAKDTYDKLKKNAVGATVKAPVSGTITALAHQAGEKTTANETIATIQLSDKAMTLSFSVTTEQAKKVKVGDAAQPQDAWAYTDFSATLKTITNDTSDPSGHKLLNFEVVSPEVTAGQSISLVMGESAVSYDLVVPNSAVREDNNGKFILVVESKASPLGNRYVASRADVQVLASDDTNTAISGSVEAYSYVITTATASVSSGDQVRLSDTDL